MGLEKGNGVRGDEAVEGEWGKRGMRLEKGHGDQRDADGEGA